MLRHLRAPWARLNTVRGVRGVVTAKPQLMSRGSADLHEVQASVVNIPINAAYLLMAVGALVETLVSYRGSRLSAGEEQLTSPR